MSEPSAAVGSVAVERWSMGPQQTLSHVSSIGKSSVVKGTSVVQSRAGVSWRSVIDGVSGFAAFHSSWRVRVEPSNMNDLL